jgi:hypothetical protein
VSVVEIIIGKSNDRGGILTQEEANECVITKLAGPRSQSIDVEAFARGAGVQVETVGIPSEALVTD